VKAGVFLLQEAPPETLLGVDGEGLHLARLEQLPGVQIGDASASALSL